MFDMQTIHVTVGPDGRVVIPGTRPGQTVTIDGTDVADTTEHVGMGSTGPIPDEEWPAIKARIEQRARKIREELPEPWLSSDHGDLLYGDDALPT
jgi:hypothetical protein